MKSTWSIQHRVGHDCQVSFLLWWQSPELPSNSLSQGKWPKFRNSSPSTRKHPMNPTSRKFHYSTKGLDSQSQPEQMFKSNLGNIETSWDTAKHSHSKTDLERRTWPIGIWTPEQRGCELHQIEEPIFVQFSCENWKAQALHLASLQPDCPWSLDSPEVTPPAPSGESFIPQRS
jgi:hypothetical protein